MRQRRDAALNRLRLMLAASIILPILLFCYAAWLNYNTAFSLADERIERALDISAQQALRVMQSINVVFDSVEQITRGRSEQSIRSSEAELSERLKQFTRALPDIASIWILDTNADAVVSSLFSPVPSAANSPDREYLKAQLAPSTALHIGDVLKIKMTDRLIFPVSKQRLDSSGTFSGTTEASIVPQAFEKFYTTLAARTSASFALIREDGTVLARYPVPTTRCGADKAAAGFFAEPAARPEAGRCKPTDRRNVGPSGSHARRNHRHRNRSQCRSLAHRSRRSGARSGHPEPCH